MAITSFSKAFASRPIAILLVPLRLLSATSTFALEPIAIEFSPLVFATEPIDTPSPPLVTDL